MALQNALDQHFDFGTVGIVIHNSLGPPWGICWDLFFCFEPTLPALASSCHLPCARGGGCRRQTEGLMRDLFFYTSLYICRYCSADVFQEKSVCIILRSFLQDAEDVIPYKEFYYFP